MCVCVMVLYVGNMRTKYAAKTWCCALHLGNANCRVRLRILRAVRRGPRDAIQETGWGVATVGGAGFPLPITIDQLPAVPATGKGMHPFIDVRFGPGMLQGDQVRRH